MKIISAIFLSVFITLLMQNFAQAQETKTSETITLNKLHFKTQLVSKNSLSGDAITFSTINGFQKKPRNVSNAWANNYITAVATKKTGEITYQINSLIEYKAHDKRLYKEVVYNTATSQKSKEATILNHSISCQGSAYSGCIHKEHVAFTVDSTLIENMANSYTEDSQNKWRYRLSPKRGRSYSAYLFIAEISALVDAVKEYQKP